LEVVEVEVVGTLSQGVSGRFSLSASSLLSSLRTALSEARRDS
jgi:hypothetical protein